MNILVCPDKFKGSLDAPQVCEAIAAGLRTAIPGALIEAVPLADGGEGTCDLLTQSNGGSTIALSVRGPLFTPVHAHYGLSKGGDTAWIEMAAASGLSLLAPEQRNALVTTTAGTGDLIADALRRNVKNIVLGIGGSATNDAGMGMAAALGYRFLDSEGAELLPVGENLIHIRAIDNSAVNPLLMTATFVTLCDVTNPLFGPEGAAYVYGPQKGAGADALAILDAGLRNFRRVVHKTLKVSLDFPGAGAAGGLGAGARAFLNSSMKKGIAFVTEAARLTEKVAAADLIITGEGRIDHQTFSGKVVSEVLRLGKQAGKPVMVICGKSDVPESILTAHGISRVLSLVDETTTPQSAMQHASTHIREKIASAFTDSAGKV